MQPVSGKKTKFRKQDKLHSKFKHRDKYRSKAIKKFKEEISNGAK